MSDLLSRTLATLGCALQALACPPQARDGGLAERIVTLADDLAAVVDDAHQACLAVPAPISNAVLDLRAWAARLFDHNLTRPTTIDATGLLAYIRGLPDQQLLALLADLPWARLDALVDTVQVNGPASSRWRQPP